MGFRAKLDFNLQVPCLLAGLVIFLFGLLTFEQDAVERTITALGMAAVVVVFALFITLVALRLALAAMRRPEEPITPREFVIGVFLVSGMWIWMQTNRVSARDKATVCVESYLSDRGYPIVTLEQVAQAARSCRSDSAYPKASDDE